MRYYYFTKRGTEAQNQRNRMFLRFTSAPLSMVINTMCLRFIVNYETIRGVCNYVLTHNYTKT